MLQWRPLELVDHGCDAGRVVVSVHHKACCPSLHHFQLVDVGGGGRTPQAYSSRGTKVSFVGCLCPGVGISLQFTAQKKEPWVLLALAQMVSMCASQKVRQDCKMTLRLLGRRHNFQCLPMQLVLAFKWLSLPRDWEGGILAWVERHLPASLPFFQSLQILLHD